MFVTWRKHKTQSLILCICMSCPYCCLPKNALNQQNVALNLISIFFKIDDYGKIIFQKWYNPKNDTKISKAIKCDRGSRGRWIGGHWHWTKDVGTTWVCRVQDWWTCTAILVNSIIIFQNFHLCGKGKWMKLQVYMYGRYSPCRWILTCSRAYKI